MGGLIYVVIMAVWAVVLVPAWLRRHDHDDPARTVDRFTRSMRQLANHPVVSGTPAQRDSRGSQMPPAAPQVRVVARPARNTARPRRTAAARRRGVLAGLAVMLIAVAALVLVGIVPPLVLSLPIIAITGFMVAARTQVRAAGASQRLERPAAPRPERTAAPTGRRAPGVHADGTWDATHSPLPSYVTAPPASPVRRMIDTETPGAWTAAAMLERAQQEKARAERMEQAKREAIAKARAEQAAAEARNRDDEYLVGEAVPQVRQFRRRVVNE